MKLASLKEGQFVETGGYYTKGDAGQAKYLIVAAQAADGWGDHTLANGTVAVLQSGDVVTLSKLGGFVSTALLDKFNEIIIDSNVTISSTLVINLNKTLHINKGVTVSVDFDGYAFNLRAGASLLGDGRIVYTVATTSGPLLMQPDGIVDYATTNFPTVGNLILQSYSDSDLQGAGITWDMTLGNGSFAQIGNLRIRSFDKSQEFTVPSGQYITSIQYGDILDIYCRATIDESGTLGQIANLHFNSLVVHPSGTDLLREYGIKTDNIKFITIDDAIFWDWDTKTNPALIKEKISLGVSTRQCNIVSPTTNQGQVTDYGTDNTVLITAAGGTLNPIESVNIPASSASYTSFNGQQDNMLVKADKVFTVTSSTVQAGTSIDRPFDMLPQNYVQFLADGTPQFLKISLGGATKVAAMGISFLDGTYPDNVSIEVWYAGATGWEVLYNSSNSKAVHSTSTNQFRGVVTDIMFRFDKATDAQGIRIPMVFAYSPDNRGRGYLDSDGFNSLYSDLQFDASAVGKGFSMIDLTLGTRHRVYLDNGVLVIV